VHQRLTPWAASATTRPLCPVQCRFQAVAYLGPFVIHNTGQGRHGRNAGYPAPPVQSRTCRFPASGASVARASAQGQTLLARARREVGSC
jgi:hypothetical protein